MIKKLLLSLVLLGSAFAQVNTANIGLIQIPDGTLNWGGSMRTNFNILDNLFSASNPTVVPGFKVTNLYLPAVSVGSCLNVGALNVVTGYNCLNLVSGPGMNCTGFSGTVTCGMTNTGVTAGSYSNVNVTVDAQGRILGISSSTGGTGLPATVNYLPSGSNQATIQAALTGAISGETIWFSGSYTACGLTLSVPDVHLLGMDEDGSVISCATASSPILTVSGAGDQVDNLNLKHVTNSPTCPGGNGTATCGDGIQVFPSGSRVRISNVHTNFNYNGIALGWTAYAVLDNFISEFNNNHGVAFILDASNPHMQWEVGRGLSEQNLGNGFDVTCPASFTNVHTPGPHFSGKTQTFGNNGYGFNFDCTAATSSGISDIWIDGAFSSQNNKSGFHFSNGGRNVIMTGTYSEQAGSYAGGAGFPNCSGNPCSQTPSGSGYGIEVTSACDNTFPPDITGGGIWQNDYSGIFAGCPGMSITGVNTFDNGFASASAQTEAGITIAADNVNVTGGYNQKGSHETSGIYIQSGDKPNIMGYQCDSNVNNCINVASIPASGFIERIGNSRWTQSDSVASGSCQNGDKWTRTNAANTGTSEWTCKNGAYVAIN